VNAVIRMPRRTVLAAPGLLTLGLATGASAQTADLRARLGACRVGANLERWYPIARDSHPRRLGAAWWRGFRAAGFDHARMFLPHVGETGDGAEVPEMFRQATQDAVEAGLPVLLGLADMHHHDQPWSEADWDALATRAAFFGARTDPAQVVLAPLNEPAFPDAATWQPVRDRMLAVVRRAAPRHILMWGGHEWCSHRSLLVATPPADPNTIVEVHDYVGGTTAEV